MIRLNHWTFHTTNPETGERKTFIGGGEFYTVLPDTHLCRDPHFAKLNRKMVEAHEHIIGYLEAEASANRLHLIRMAARRDTRRQAKKLAQTLAALDEKRSGHRQQDQDARVDVGNAGPGRLARIQVHEVDIPQNRPLGEPVAGHLAADEVHVVLRALQEHLEQLVADLGDLVGRARSKRLIPSEMSGSTFTISNLGMFGIEQFTAIINPPESAILAVGTIVDTPSDLGGQLEVRPTMRLTLSADHRVVDGAAGARFLADLKATLENPYLLI